MSFAVPSCLRYWPVAAALSLLLVSPVSLAQRVSARDRAAADALEQRMAAAEKRYRDGLVLVANSDPRGASESDAALEEKFFSLAVRVMPREQAQALCELLWRLEELESIDALIVPTLRVGMQPGTLRVPSRAERGASVEAFPRRAWERST